MERLVITFLLITIGFAALESALTFQELNIAQAYFYSYYPYHILYYEVPNATENVHSFFCWSEMSYNIKREENKVYCPFTQTNDQTQYRCVYLTDDGVTNSSLFYKIVQYRYRFPNETKDGGVLRENDSQMVYLYEYKNFQQIEFDPGYFNRQAFYKMTSCENFNIKQRKCETIWKQNYIHTHHDTFYIENLILPTFHNCQVYEGTFNSTTANNLTFRYYINVFYQGCIRKNKTQFFYAAVVVRGDSTPYNLNMWGGFSYSYDHYNRDGVCFSTESGRVFDMICLMASGCYADTAENIGADNNIELVTQSYRQDTKNFRSYFVHFHRTYSSQDFFGDQQIAQKLYPTYSFAAYFDHQFNNKTLSCQDKDQKHQIVMRYRVDLSIYGACLRMGIIVFVALAFV